MNTKFYTPKSKSTDIITTPFNTNKRYREESLETIIVELSPPKRVNHQKLVGSNFKPIQYHGGGGESSKGKEKQQELFEESSSGDESEDEDSQKRRRLTLNEGWQLYTIILNMQQEDEMAAKFIRSKNAIQWNAVEDEYNNWLQNKNRTLAKIILFTKLKNDIACLLKHRVSDKDITKKKTSTWAHCAELLDQIHALAYQNQQASDVPPNEITEGQRKQAEERRKLDTKKLNLEKQKNDDHKNNVKKLTEQGDQVLALVRELFEEDKLINAQIIQFYNQNKIFIQIVHNV